MIVIELQNNGNEVQDELMRRGWTNFYKRYNVNGREKRFEGLGWNTTRGSRPKLTDTLIKAVKDQWFEINSPWLLREIEDLETNETLQSIRVEAKAGSRDDRAICTGMLLAATHSEIAPTSQNSVVQRLLKNLQERTKTQSITPLMLENALHTKDSIVYFGSSPIIAPNDEGLLDGDKRSNLWN